MCFVGHVGPLLEMLDLFLAVHQPFVFRFVFQHCLRSTLHFVSLWRRAHARNVRLYIALLNFPPNILKLVAVKYNVNKKNVKLFRCVAKFDWYSRNEFKEEKTEIFNISMLISISLICTVAWAERRKNSPDYRKSWCWSPPRCFPSLSSQYISNVLLTRQRYRAWRFAVSISIYILWQGVFNSLFIISYHNTWWYISVFHWAPWRRVYTMREKHATMRHATCVKNRTM